MKDILSIFDHSGNWPAFYEDAGHNVMLVDLKHDADAHNVAKFSVRHYFEMLQIENVDAIISAPPCTDFTNSGAWVWAAKDADGRTKASVHLVRNVLRSVDLWKPDFWTLENPVGRLPKLVPELGKPTLLFDPCDYAGWVTLTAEEEARLEELRGYFAAGRSFTAADIALVKRSNRYTKKTCLWGNFRLPEKRRIEPVKVCASGSWLMRLGGKGSKTKEARSETPLGFARAFYEANSWNSGHAAECDLRRMVEWATELEFDDAERAADEADAEFGFGAVSRETFLREFGKTLLPKQSRFVLSGV